MAMKSALWIYLMLYSDIIPNERMGIFSFQPYSMTAQMYLTIAAYSNISFVQKLLKSANVADTNAIDNQQFTETLLLLIVNTLAGRLLFRDIVSSRQNFMRVLNDMGIDYKSSSLYNVKSSLGSISYSEWFQTVFLPFLPNIHQATSGLTTFSLIDGVRSLKIMKGIKVTTLDDGSDLVMDVLYNPSFKYNLDNIRYVMYVHGGAWITGYHEAQSVPYQVYLTTSGFIVCSINYRYCPSVTVVEQVRDIKRSLIFIKNKLEIKDIGIKHPRVGDKPRRVAVTGESAGGHLSLMIALTQNDPAFHPSNNQKQQKGEENGEGDQDTSVIACVDLYGIHDVLDKEETFFRLDQGEFRCLTGGVVIRKDRETQREYYEQVSPLSLIESNDSWCNKLQPPPIFGVHGSHDNLIPIEDARIFYDRLKTARRKWKSTIKDGFCDLVGAHHAFNFFLSANTHSMHDAAFVFLEHCFNQIETKSSNKSKL